MAVTTTGSATLDAESWSHARLTQTDRRLLANMFHRLTQANSRRRLTFTKWRRRNRSYYDIFCLGARLQRINRIQTYLGETFAIRLKKLAANTHLSGNLGERLSRGFARNFKI